MKFFKTIKFRLTNWYVLVIIILLVAFGVIAYLLLWNNLYQSLDRTLQSRVESLENTLKIVDGQFIFDQSPDELIFIFDSGGELIQKTGPDMDFINIDVLVGQALLGRSSFLTTRTAQEQEVRLYAAPFSADSQRVAIVVGRSTADIKEMLGGFLRVLAISEGVIVFMALIGGWFLASRALKPVDTITRTARAISEKDLSQRIEVTSDDELGRLAATLNQMIERLSAAFNQQRQFTADASHELRTPLAVIQAESSLALNKERTEEEYKKSLELISQESSYLSSLVSKLLYLAHGDAREESGNPEEFDLQELLSFLCEDVEILAREKGLEFKAGPFTASMIKGDKIKMRQMFINIMENAIKYTPAGGCVSVSASKKNSTAIVAIKDTGAGIPPEHLPHIFERFYRVDKARSRSEGGTGLGLAIAQQIAVLHNGKIEVESDTGKGTTFYITMPLIPRR